ncbi:MAG: hypothetical protein WA208_18550 [Thermoanaerobaculia bacterium]
MSKLCRSGRLYAVEQWIKEGKPLYAENYSRGRGRRVQSALSVAIETKQVDLALLLLCNGFPPDAGGESLLDDAVRDRQEDFVELLMKWGADPLRLNPYDVLDSYDADLYERFWTLGLDFARNHALARMLAGQSSNRPAYGWARRHNTEPKVARELAIALVHAVAENRERAVALLVWAGADPRRPAPDLRYMRADEDEPDEDCLTAIEYAVMYGYGHLLKTLKPHPTRDNFERLWAWVCDETAIDYLGKLARPEDWSAVLTRNLDHALSRYSGDASRKCVEKLTVSYGARLTAMTPERIAQFRRDVVRSDNESGCRWVLRWMSYEETCEPSVFAELTRTPSVRAKLNSLHIRDARYRY